MQTTVKKRCFSGCQRDLQQHLLLSYVKLHYSFSGDLKGGTLRQLDGILGELRPMYAGEIQNWDFAPPKLKEEETLELANMR